MGEEGDERPPYIIHFPYKNQSPVSLVSAALEIKDATQKERGALLVHSANSKVNYEGQFILRSKHH